MTDFYCHKCKIAGGDYGPISDQDVLFKSIAQFHNKCPGWSGAPPEPKIQKLATQIFAESNLNIENAKQQAKDMNEKMAKQDITTWSQGSDFAYGLLQRFKFATLEDTKIILMYKDGIYTDKGESIISRICEDEIKNCKRDLVNEIIGVIKRKTEVPRKVFEVEPFEVCVENCIINIRTGAVTEHSPKRMFRSKIPVTFNPRAQCPKFIKFLHTCLPSSSDYIDQLEAFACGLLKNTPKLEAMFFETGKGDNGKSTFLSMVNWFFGEDNVSTVSIHEFIFNKFAKARLENKMINTFPDIESDALDNFGVLKALVSGDAIDAEFKYQNPYTFVNRAKLFFSGNELPEIKEKTFATFKRIRLTKWTQNFLKAQDYNLKKDIMRSKFPEWTEKQIEDELMLSGVHRMNRQFIDDIINDDVEKSGILNLLLIVVRNIIKRDGFFNDYTHDQLNELWSENSTMIEAFCKDCLMRDSDSYIPKSKVYQVYHFYCRQNGKPAKPDNVVHPIIQNLFNVEPSYKKVSGVSTRVYNGLKWNVDSPIVKKLGIKGVQDTAHTPFSKNYMNLGSIDSFSEKHVSDVSKRESFADE